MKKVLILLCSLILNSILFSADNSIYFLSIGVQNYAEPVGISHFPGAKIFSNASSGNHSASRVAYHLSTRGAEWGLLVVDGANSYVTRRDILNSVNEAISAASNADNPLLVIYYNGHGVGEGLGFGHFLVPGDFVGPYPITDIVAASESQLVSVLEVLELINNAELPYLLLLDTCYDGNKKDFQDTLIPDIENFGQDVTGILRALNSSYAAITASQPTEETQSIIDPNKRFLHKTVGPLARRMLLALEKHERGQITVQSLVDQLTAESFDVLTGPARNQPEGFKWNGVFPKIGRPSDFTIREATETVANIEPLQAFAQEQERADEEAQGVYYQLSAQPAYAKVRVKAGSFGDWRLESIGKVEDETDLVFATPLRNSADFSTAASDISGFRYDIPLEMLPILPERFALSKFDRFDNKPGIGFSYRGTNYTVKQGEAFNVVGIVEDGMLQTLAMEFSVVFENDMKAVGVMDIVW